MDATCARNSVWIISHCMLLLQHNATQSAAAHSLSARLLQVCKCKAAAEEHVQVQGCCCCTCTWSSSIMQQRKHAAHQKAATLHAGLLKIVKNYFSRIYHVGKIFVQRVLSCEVYSAQESLECSYSFHTSLQGFKCTG